MTTGSLDASVSNGRENARPMAASAERAIAPGGCTILPRKMIGSLLVIACAATAGAIAQDGRAVGALAGAVGADHWFLADAPHVQRSGVID